MEPHLLEISNLGLFRGGQWNLRGIHFYVDPGSTLGVVGESGSGKTTLMHLILGLLEPTEGWVRFKKLDWSFLPEKIRRSHRPGLQAVFQDPMSSLPPHRTGWEILSEPLDIHHIGNRASRRDRAAQMAHRVKFPEPSLEQKPGEWSGGLAQRLALARALMLEPELLILDEPLSALDPTLGGHLLELLLELKSQGMSLLFVSHDLPAVQRLCDQLLVLYDGEMMCQGPTTTLLADLRHPYLRGLWESIPPMIPGRLPLRWASQEDAHPPFDGACRLYGRCPKGEDICRQKPDWKLDLRCHLPLSASHSDRVPATQPG